MTVPRLTKRRTSLEKHQAEVIALLLTGWSSVKVAEHYAVTKQAVCQFMRRHQDKLSELTEQAAAAVLSVAIRDKAERIRRYAQYLDGIEELVQSRGGYEATDVKWVGGVETGREVEVRRFDAALVSEMRACLRGVAEELGDIPQMGSASIVAENIQIVYNNVPRLGI